MDKQELRNALSDIEDRARALRRTTQGAEVSQVANLVVRLTKLVREEIVK